jgi:hypothetical protein
LRLFADISFGEGVCNVSGGIGVGLINLITFALLTVFLGRNHRLYQPDKQVCSRNSGVRPIIIPEVIAAFGLLVCIASAGTQAFGQAVSTAPIPAPNSKETKKMVGAPPKAPKLRFKIYGWIEGGITGNPDSPIDNHNFGHLYTDRANGPLLNQLSIVGERPLDPNINAN